MRVNLVTVLCLFVVTAFVLSSDLYPLWLKVVEVVLALAYLVVDARPPRAARRTDATKG